MNHQMTASNIVSSMLATHPAAKGAQSDLLVRCIEACHACDSACTACADACLAEPMVDQLRACIRLNLDCADICGATGRMLLRQTATDWSVVQRTLEACRVACQQCEAECRRHASMHEHCRVCADACAMCAEACQAVLSGSR